MRIIKKLDIYILRNFLLMFAGTFCISLFVLMMQFLWKYVDDLVGKGFGFDVLAKFFFYAGETLVPMALPLAILLASLISFGNLGERLELLSIKAAGISLIRTMAPLIILMAMLSGVSFYFQDKIAPQAWLDLTQLRFSMMQKSPELDIPEGVFYDGIEGVNLFVRQKDKETGILRDVIIYNMRNGANNAQIIVADSAKLETSANKQFLLLQLYGGEQFENLNSGALIANNVPYRRETFVEKRLIIDFDTNFTMAESDMFTSSARTKTMKQIEADIDSMEQETDSIGHSYYNDLQAGPLFVYKPSSAEVKEMLRDISKNGIPTEGNTTQAKSKPTKITEKELASLVDVDSLFAKMDNQRRAAIVSEALSRVQQTETDYEFKTTIMTSEEEQIRKHWIEYWKKITTALTCLLFFFIGAPLGAIIRKGGLGFPIVVAVIIFLAYFIIDNGAMRTGKAGTIPVWLGMWTSTIILAPLAIFFTVKSNNDSVVFNMDSYRAFFRKLFGIRQKRYITKKEVIINDPDYPSLAERIQILGERSREYRKGLHRKLLLQLLLHIVRNRKDNELAWICEEMDACVAELANSKDHRLLLDLNLFPIINQEPRFYNRLRKDFRQTIEACTKVETRINEITA